MSGPVELRQALLDAASRPEARCPFPLTPDLTVELYPRSIQWLDDEAIAIAAVGGEKHLLAVSLRSYDRAVLDFEGASTEVADRCRIRRCPMNHHNADVVRELFEFARPVLIGTANSYGFGDRLGVANPAHLRAVRGSGFRAVLAQQSIRELERTERTPEDVMNAATWAVLQEGFHEGFGSDADHLKLPEHIDRMAAAGFTMYTIDPGDHVVNEADVIPAGELVERADQAPWNGLEDTLDGALSRYSDIPVSLAGDLVLKPSKEQVLRAVVKYGGAIAHTAAMYRHLVSVLPPDRIELEVSVDETESVTTSFEHLFFASELRRLGVSWAGLAPRFVGDFEKGIDFRGDLELFRTEYLKHLAIAEAYGGYKISIHSGSDKFSVYRVIGDLGHGRVHVKTAGTSYLEALRTAAVREPDLFREILDFSRGLYETERRTYHVTAELARVPEGRTLNNDELPRLLDDDDARRVLHVTFGRVLTERKTDGDLLFKEDVMSCLRRHESTHDQFVEAHFRRHLEPFVGAR